MNTSDYSLPEGRDHILYTGPDIMLSEKKGLLNACCKHGLTFTKALHKL